MYINFWYPVILSSELTDEPHKVRMLGQDFIVFRDSGGTPSVLANTCTHRGGSLADGKIKGDCIQCPYHGWEFDGEGACRRIPSLGPDANIPTRARVDAYPVIEKYGLVLAFLGDQPEAERAPFLEIPEFDDEGWRPTWINYQVPVNFERSIENGLDPAHNEFVHPTHGFSGEREGYKVNDLRWIGDGEWGPAFFSKFRSPDSKDPDFAKIKEASDSREAGSGVIGPNHMWTYIRFAPGKHLHQYMYECPIDEHNVNIFLVNLRSTLLEADKDQKVNDMNWMIAQQDIVVLSDVRPVITPSTNTREFMVPADEPIVRYREKLKEWDGRGWRIDSEEVDRNTQKTAYAIPCPERRNRKGWVLDSIPVLQTDDFGDTIGRLDAKN
jgi:phenylpropionate dioxygenase-like ring-hydroxylating dioxygenase large terminal subunit